jgi:uncharacterized membrane protein YfcA
MDWLLLIFIGVISGSLAGLLGIGGGILLVSCLQANGFSYPEAIATSSFAIVITSVSGSYQNMRMGYLNLKKVIILAIPAMITSFIATYLVNILADSLLQFLFALLILINIYLTYLKQDLSKEKELYTKINVNKNLAILLTGSLAGILAGIFGIGGGLVLVPLQMLFLNEKIKPAIQTSLAVIVFTSIFTTIGHYNNGNINFGTAILVGLGGLVGVQFSTRFLPTIPEKKIHLLYNTLLIALASYSIYLSFNHQ